MTIGTEQDIYGKPHHLRINRARARRVTCTGWTRLDVEPSPNGPLDNRLVVRIQNLTGAAISMGFSNGVAGEEIADKEVRIFLAGEAVEIWVNATGAVAFTEQANL